MLELTDQNFEQEVLKSDVSVLVDFWAPGCPPCEMIKPTIEEVAEEFEGKAKVGKLNVAENPEIAQQYKIMGVPTLIIFKNGKGIKRATGLRPKEAIVSALNSML
ncbi:unnamed protein product [marine sediment metagenome]|uniref:Thioredoxin domain-containing protein n=1 Tax=marine sediment metagenome TaxID=412755 RepID=X0VKJ6_9ZZZZ